MTAQHTGSTPSDDLGRTDHTREALIDQEISEVRGLLDRVDGLTHDARRRLRRLEHHREGVAPEWIERHR